MHNWWKSGRPDIVIRMADGKDIKYLFDRGFNNIPIGPTERAVFIKEGRLLGIIDKDSLKIANRTEEDLVHALHWKKETNEEKIKNNLSKVFDLGAPEDLGLDDYFQMIRKKISTGYINVLIVDATSIDLEFPFDDTDEIYTADAGDRLGGTLTLRFEFDPHETPKQLKLLGRAQAVTLNALRKRLRDEIISEVIKPTLKEFSSDEIYGNREVRSTAEMSVLHQMKKTLGLWGIVIEKVILNLDTPGKVKMDSHLAKRKAAVEGEMAIDEMEQARQTMAHRHKLEMRAVQEENRMLLKHRETESKLDNATSILNILDERRKDREERLYSRKKESEDRDHEKQLQKKNMASVHLTRLQDSSDAMMERLLKQALASGNSDMVRQLRGVMGQKSVQIAVTSGKAGDTGVAKAAFTRRTKAASKEKENEKRMMAKLMKLKKMRDSGILGEELFQEKVKELLARYGY
ncbi:MAG: hypothetical protein QGH39_04435 [Candidatus Thermoplasmatota archaeon]|jgi:hypothetical protein|nr:hypothetical protein [Candidatus Thermoplasmatota archaeon]MDP7264791.1 hypothetical protein [Candidatus Thermoplasmatota archaeon]